MDERRRDLPGDDARWDARPARQDSHAAAAQGSRGTPGRLLPVSPLCAHCQYSRTLCATLRYPGRTVRPNRALAGCSRAGLVPRIRQLAGKVDVGEPPLHPRLEHGCLRAHPAPDSDTSSTVSTPGGANRARTRAPYDQTNAQHANTQSLRPRQRQAAPEAVCWQGRRRSPCMRSSPC